jgi:hypothetical protein
MTFTPRANTFYNAGDYGGSGPNATTYTKAQVGAAAKPNPAPPGATGWAGSNAYPDPRRVQYAGSGAPQPATQVAPPTRAFRGGGWGAQPDVIFQGPGTQTPSGAVTGRGSQTVVGHQQGNGFNAGQPDKANNPAYPATTEKFRGGSNAVPDLRRQFNVHGDPSGYPVEVSPEAYPQAFQVQNNAIVGVGGGGQVPAEWRTLAQKLLNQRPRAGGTSADDYRPARRWTQPPSMRPFDKNGLRYGMLGRHSLPGPLASTPLFYPADVANGLPTAGGHFAAPGMNGVGIQKNTVRMVPQAWDQALISPTSGDQSAQIQSSYRARAWKAG